MVHDKDVIQNEIQLKDDECCIVFDFGCYFPYSNFEVLNFSFSLGMESFDDVKVNHRYPNKSYQTISKKYGRKISKMGYPYVMKLNEQGPMLLCLKVGLCDKYMTLVFPVETNMTKEKPICGLSLHYMFDDSKFYFESHELAEDGIGWHPHDWYSNNWDKPIHDDSGVLMTAPHRINDESFILLYADFITPYAQALDNCLV